MIENIQQIKDSINIVEIIESYLPLRRNGDNYISCCPFHNEKTPSFSVSKSKNIWHCFGCGLGGNGIDFIIKKENLDFIAAVRKAANICGIDLKESYNENVDKVREKIKDLQARLETLQKEQYLELLKHEKLMKYLEKRGFNSNLQAFDFGLNLDKKRIIEIMTYEGALNLNLITEKGYNFFNNRLMLAIRNNQNKIVGFSGRTHDYFNFSNQPKYLNSKESILYKKSDILYNINHVKALLKQTNEIYIVEGYFDSLTCNLLGIPSVALCGTALNANHLKNLSKLINDNTQIYISLDSDSPGRDATLRAVKVMLEYGFVESNVARLNPTYKDINEFYINSNNKNIPFAKSNAIEYALKVELGLATNIKKKQEILRYYREYINNCKDIFTRKYVEKILAKFNLIETPRMTETSHNIKEQEIILNQLAIDKQKRFLARDILSSDEFKDKKAYDDIMAGKENADTRKYLILDSINMDNETFYKIILRYKIFSLESKKQKAMEKSKIDIKYLVALNEKISEYKNTLDIPF